MTTPEVAGLDVVLAAAAQCGVDTSDTLAKLTQIMAADPNTMRSGSAQMRNLGTALGTVQDAVQRTGSDLVANANWTGSTAEAFAPQPAALANGINDHRTNLNALASNVESFAAQHENAQHAAAVATGVAATKIRAQQVVQA
jgi:hypothetical protein